MDFADKRVFPGSRYPYSAVVPALRRLEEMGLIAELYVSANPELAPVSIRFVYTDLAVKDCLCIAGNILELYIWQEARKTRFFDDVQSNFTFTWKEGIRNELDVMLFLLNNPGLDRAADIVSRRGIAKSHVSQSVGILEEKGFLRRCEDSADRRTVRLKLTEAAMPIAREGQEAQKRFFARIHRNVSGEELAFLRDLMQRVRDNIVAIED